MSIPTVAMPQAPEATPAEPQGIVAPVGNPDGYPKAFVIFHERHPGVYLGILHHAYDLKRLGWRNVGVRYLFEHQRYTYDPASVDDAALAYGLDNNWAAWYARLIEQNEGGLEGFFRLRRMKGEVAAGNESQLGMEFD